MCTSDQMVVHWLSCFEKIGGTGRTDRRTDGVQRLMRLPEA